MQIERYTIFFHSGNYVLSNKLNNKQKYQLEKEIIRPLEELKVIPVDNPVYNFI